MTKNEIKKELYREKPTAYINASESEHGDTVYYSAIIESSNKQVFFEIPKHEAEGFDETMSAQLLIRWLKD